MKDLKEKKEKLDSVTRHSTKKLNRRDVKLSEQNDSLRLSERELTLKSVECEKKTSQLEQMRKEKRNLLVKDQQILSSIDSYKNLRKNVCQISLGQLES